MLEGYLLVLGYVLFYFTTYVVGSKSFRPDIQKPRQMKMLWGIYSAIYELLVHRCEECVEIKGDYVEKQQSCFISVTLKSWSGRKLLDPTAYVYPSRNVRHFITWATDSFVKQQINKY